MNYQKSVLGFAIAACLFSVTAKAEESGGDNAFTDIAGRWYVSPLYSATGADKDRQTDDGTGFALAIGKQVNRYFNFELYGFQTEYDALMAGEKDGQIQGIGLSALGFPFAQQSGGTGRWLGGAFGLVGVGYGEGEDFPEREGFFDANHDRFIIDAGLGYLLRIPFVRFASLRLEARYRLDLVKDPFAAVDGDDDENEEPAFEEMVLSAGLMIPLGARPQPPAPPPPVAVVAPVLVCSDGVDNDGDGLIDFPADPGCTAVDDVDETDPPQCSDGKDNDGDGLVDFPSDKGCAAADDKDETNPCNTSETGEKISLRGCGTGDVIVLRGVNFEFDKSNLTANAKTILDDVAEELSAHPEIKIELGGHTDAKGSNEYNQSLSEQRAASVVGYLASKGLAKERMRSAGYGESSPVADNETDEGRELNRRVELKITEGIAPVVPSAIDNPVGSAELPSGAAASP